MKDLEVSMKASEYYFADFDQVWSTKVARI